MSIRKKIFNVMKACTNIPKNGYNSAQKYNYVREVDAKETIRKALIENNLIVVPVEGRIDSCESVGAKGWRLTNITMDYDIMDVESDEIVRISCPGAGADGGDKGIYKAITGSVKYLGTTAFWIPADNDPEAAEEAPQVMPVSKARELINKTVTYDQWEKARKWIKENYEIHDDLIKELDRKCQEKGIEI